MLLTDTARDTLGKPSRDDTAPPYTPRHCLREHSIRSSLRTFMLLRRPRLGHVIGYAKKKAFPFASRLIFDIFSSKSAPASYSFQREAGNMCLFLSYHLLSTTLVIDGSWSLPSRFIFVLCSNGRPSALVPCVVVL